MSGSAPCVQRPLNSDHSVFSPFLRTKPSFVLFPRVIAAEILSLVVRLFGELEVLAVVDFHVDSVLDSVVDSVADFVADFAMLVVNRSSIHQTQSHSNPVLDSVLDFVLDGFGSVLGFVLVFVLEFVLDLMANLKVSHWLHRLTDRKMCPETTENLVYLEMRSDLTTMDLVLAFVLDFVLAFVLEFVAYLKVSRCLHRLAGWKMAPETTENLVGSDVATAEAGASEGPPTGTSEVAWSSGALRAYTSVQGSMVLTVQPHGMGTAEPSSSVVDMQAQGVDAQDQCNSIILAVDGDYEAPAEHRLQHGMGDIAMLRARQDSWRHCTINRRPVCWDPYCLIAAVVVDVVV